MRFRGQKSKYKIQKMDDLFDIIGISLFASNRILCTLNNTPCIPLPFCSQYIIDGKCKYGYTDDDKNEGKDE
jgi:hypothetical protein